MPMINPERLVADLRTLRSFGSHDHGVVRPSLSPVDLEARHWLRGRMHEAGLEAHLDGVGNVIGRSPNAGKALLIGSHSDTQPTGGWLDGALGVIYALEVVRACAEDAHTQHLAIDPVAWIDEENTFISCLGSRAYCGVLQPGEIEAAHNREGVALTEALRQAGLDGIAAQPEPGRYLGYLEAHIEQGAYLENAGKQIGVVSAIVGSRNYTVRFHGQQNHAGTTPMPIRRDAGKALIDFAYHVQQAFQHLAGPRTVWTIGRVAFHPGAASIIPGRADMHLQFRDPDPERLEAFAAQTSALIAEANDQGPVAVTIEAAGSPIQPADMDPNFQHHIAVAAEQHAPGKWEHMPSAAIHDAMFLAQIMPAGMLFVPSINGISHDFAEDTSDADIVRGCQVMATAVASILGVAQG